MFRHHDKERVGSLNHDDLKSCLRALGYDLPMLEEGVIDPEFEQILDFVDRERLAFVLFNLTNLSLLQSNFLESNHCVHIPLLSKVEKFAEKSRYVTQVASNRSLPYMILQVAI